MSLLITCAAFWTLFKDPGFLGQRTILTPGNYSNPSFLPGGDNALSSLRKMPAP